VIKYKDFYSYLIESTDTNYGYWIGKSGQKIPVPKWGLHDRSMLQYLKDTNYIGGDIKEYEAGYVGREKGFLHLSVARNAGILYVSCHTILNWEHLPRKQREVVEDIAEERNLKIYFNEDPIVGNIHESSELTSLYKKSSELFDDIRRMRKTDPEYYNKDEYSRLKKEFDLVSDQIEDLQLEEEPEKELHVSNGQEYINYEYLDNIYRKNPKNSIVKRLIDYRGRAWATDFIELRNEVISKVKEHTSKIPYVNINSLKSSLLSAEDSEKTSLNEFFPIIIEVSSSPSDDMTISVVLESDGKFSKIFEGNDEATDETIRLVNNLINPVGKEVKIYGTHGREIVEKIRSTGTLPSGLYVSPDREYSSGYMDLEGDREKFSGHININDINQESDVDWKTINPTKIEKFRYL
jgi:uncharacterized protein YlzI (FlbEa/FlbD family)